MHLDPFTLLFVGCLAICPFALQFLFFWLRDRKATWLAWWSMIFACGTLSLVLVMLREQMSDMVTIGIGNVLVFMTYGGTWVAARAFEGRKARFDVVIAAAFVWLLLCQWPFFMQSLSLRVVVASSISAAFILAGAYELWRGRAEALPSRWPMIWAYLGYALFLLARIPAGAYVPFPLGWSGAAAWGYAVFGAAFFICLSAVSTLMISMTKERLEVRQRGFALLDPLTGVGNRRAFDEQAMQIARRRKVSREPMALLVMDLDHFKQINDQFGHATGDKVLIDFVEVVRAAIRVEDSFYRMGGEEFCCLLSEATLQQAMAVGERIRKAFETHGTELENGVVVRGTVSIGVAASETMGPDLHAMQAAADAAVYSAKARGRNCVVAAGTALGVRSLFADTMETRAPITGARSSIVR